MSGGKQASSISFAMRRLAYWLVELDRYPKRVILAINDFVLFHLSLWLAVSLRLGELFFPPNWSMFMVLARRTTPAPQ